MSEPTASDNPLAGLGTKELHSALLANLVLQQSSMAMVFLGRTPHPETGKPVVDLEAAKVFIDTLDMLEAKTRGNLEKQEENLLKQSLMTVRMAFVETVNNPPPAAPPSSEPAKPPAAAPPASPEGGQTTPAPSAAPADAPAAEAESHKKFSKKY